MRRIGKLEARLYKSLPALQSQHCGWGFHQKFKVTCFSVYVGYDRPWEVLGGSVEEECVLEASFVYVCAHALCVYVCLCVCTQACGGGSLCACLHFLSAVNKLPCYCDYIHPHVLPDLYHEHRHPSQKKTSQIYKFTYNPLAKILQHFSYFIECLI